MDTGTMLHLPAAGSSAPPRDFGTLIAEYRARRGLSQGALALLLGTSRNTVSNWEQSKCLPDGAALRQLAQVLQIPACELLGTEGERLTAPESRLLQQYRSLSDVGRSTLSDLAAAMLRREQEAKDTLLRSRFRVLPLEATPAAAGVGCREISLPAEPVFVPDCRQSRRADVLVRVSGDSMEPKYHDGDLVYLRFAKECLEGEDVVCVYHEGFIIKRCYGNKLYSLNPARDFGDNHEEDDIRMVGVVLGIVEPEDLPGEEDLPLLRDLFAEEIRALPRENTGNCL